jgi:hyaluronoglucosaminidase
VPVRRRFVVPLVAVCCSIVLQMTGTPVTASATTTTTSPFSFRGVIEGFYGTPWSPAATESALWWMGEQGLNTFVYAPKDDPYERADWRLPYPPAQLASLASEIDVGRAAGVTWVPDISPGLPLIPGAPVPGQAPSRDICFSCPSDRQVLYDKLDQFWALGVRTFMISFDDVQMASSNPQDAETYGVGPAAYGEMNRDLLNALYRHFQAKAGGSGFTLLTVLADYSGTADSAYLQAVRSKGGLDPGIQVFWTGTATVSATVTAAQAAAYAALVGRSKVLLWDNYPANDYTGGIFGEATRLFMGPYEGRSPDLADSVLGVLANPMVEPLASRTALATMASYLADPTGYQPETAWQQAIAGEAGGDKTLAAALFSLADNSRSSTLDHAESPAFVAARDALLSAYQSGPFWVGDQSTLSDLLSGDRSAPGVISARWPALAAEIPGFLQQLGGLAKVAADGVHALAAERPSLSAAVSAARAGTLEVTGKARPPSPAVAASWVTSMTSEESLSFTDPDQVYGDRLETDLSTIYAGQNQVDQLAADVLHLSAQWSPRAALAASAVSVTVDGRSVPVGPSGGFSAVVPRPTSGSVTVVATDGSGGTTGLVIAA